MVSILPSVARWLSFSPHEREGDAQVVSEVEGLPAIKQRHTESATSSKAWWWVPSKGRLPVVHRSSQKVDDILVSLQVLVPHVLQDVHLKHTDTAVSLMRSSADTQHGNGMHSSIQESILQLTQPFICPHPLARRLTSTSPCCRNRFLFRTILTAISLCV